MRNGTQVIDAPLVISSVASRFSDALREVSRGSSAQDSRANSSGLKY